MNLMKRIIGQKKTARLALLMLAAALLCSGCLGRSGGGVHTAKGMTLIEAGDCEGALKEFETAILEGEDEVPAYRGQGIAYMGLDHCEEAAVSFDMALSYTDRKMDKTRQDILLYKASACCRSGSYEEARDACDKLLEQDETLTEALFLRGVACLGLGQQEQARTAFDAAGASSGGDYDLYLRIYEVYESRSLTAIGDEYLQTALQITPSGDEDYCRMGQIYYYLRQYDQAQEVLRSPVEKKYVPALSLMGEIYLARGDHAHAAAMYQDIEDREGKSPVSCNGLALCSLAQGEIEQALAYIEEGLSLEGEEGKQELYFNEIVAYERLLQFDTAKQKAQAFIERYPADEAGRKEYDFLMTR